MQSIDSPVPHTLAGQILAVLALLLTGSSLSSVIHWLVNRRKAKAEVVEINAQTVKVQAEARQLDTDTVIRASARIEELLDINTALRNELIEANRRLDNSDFDLRQLRYEMAQMETRAKLREYLIGQLEAANKLGVKLSDLPPAPKQDEENSS